MFKSRLSLLIPAILLLVLGGCATHQKTTPAETLLSQVALEQAWEQNQALAKNVLSWHVRGRAGVRTEEQSGSVTINWERSPEEFSIYMTGPLGQTLARLEGQGAEGVFDYIVLDVPGQEPIASRSAEDLLYSQTGWYLPFRALDY